ncbi:hypothetical protein ABO04_07905 [Nitrosomonas sp. HPC101]|uniref:uroporphyrinogen-III C-methyltransferase n=1 Tax=Nitrosomonas sp. HPC101 TaxID=1658667 RepID=UPI00136917B5|nr:uroporphyrinogen-III C-methyltransferase [Nitrosomonas sp. HPC101]MXS85831.1 hypothetical protein [Nitrosomonas sp. HPC101]
MNKYTQVSTSGSARRLAVVVLMILLIAMAFMLWKWAEKQGHISAMEHSLTAYLADADVFSSHSREILAELELEKTEIEQRLSRLEERLQVARELPVEVGKLPDDGSNRAEVWILGAVERLVVAADRDLQLTGDVRSALDSLKYAQELLQSAEISSSPKLNEMLAEDIEQLEAVAAVDIQEINRDITELAAQIDSLPLMMDSNLIEIDWPEKQDTPKPGLWHRYLHEIKRDFSRLVKIEKMSDSGTSLLSPSQIRLLKENIRLQLMQARLALLTRDEHNFRAAVKTATNWIQKYFNTEAQSVKDALGGLERLASINIGSQLPNLGEMLGIVYHDQLMLKGESE